MRLQISLPLIWSTLTKFTLSFLFALAIMALAMRVNHNSAVADYTWFCSLMITLVVFIPWMGIAERRPAITGDKKMRLLGTAKVLILALLYYIFRAPNMRTEIMQDGYMLQIGLHIFITRGSLFRIIPTLMKRDVKKARMHCYQVVSDTVITGIFCGVLLGGLAAALSAIDYLFGINIPSELYGDLRAVILGAFGSLFWLTRLSLVPVSYFFNHKDFPKVLRIFAEYILGFLLIVYAVILLAYTAKITLSGVWPSGTVAGLIFGFLAMGVIYVTILLPRITDTDNDKLRLNTRILGILFVGAAILLWAALQQRVTQYGWTVERALVILVCIWSLCIAGSLILSRPSINYRLTSGVVIGFLGFYAPGNIFFFAQQDQLARLDQDLQTAKFDSNTKKADASLATGEVNAKVSDRVQYLLRYHGTDALIGRATDEVLAADTTLSTGDRINGQQYYWNLTERIVTSRGFQYVPYMYYDGENGLRYIYFNATYPKTLDVTAYTVMQFIEAYQDPAMALEPKLPQDVGRTTLNATPETPNYTINLAEKKLYLNSKKSQEISLDQFIEQAKLTNSASPKEGQEEALMLSGDNFLLYVTNLNATVEYKDGKDVTTLTSFNGLLLAR